MYTMLAATCMLLSSGAHAQPPRAVQIEPWGADSLRIRIPAPGGSLPVLDPPFMPLLPFPPTATTPVTYSLDRLTVTNGNIAASANPETGLLTISRVADGLVLLQQNALEVWGAAAPHARQGAASATLTFDGVPEADGVYGFGQLQDGAVRRRLPFVQSIQATEYYPNSHGSNALFPWYMSTAGYGFLWNLPSYGVFSLSSSQISFYSNATLSIDFWVTTAPAASRNPLADVLATNAAATGLPSELPSFATGFIQCKDRYRNQTQLLAVAAEYKSRGLPISMIVQDWFHWRQLGDWSFNPTCYPDPAGMVEQLRASGIELMVTFWPFVNTSSTHWASFSQNKFLAINASSGTPDMFWYCQTCENEGGALVDATNPAARNATFEGWWQSYGSIGIRSVWLDETEPDRYSPSYGVWNLAGGADSEVGAAWVQQWTRVWADGFASKGIKPNETFVLSRSSWAGTQRYGNTLWSGDLHSSWADFTLQVPAGQAAGLSGQVYWTTDAGGYSGGNPADPSFQELIVRWLQFAAFSPIMRLHGHRDGGPPPNECGATNGDNEIWNLASDPAHYDAMVAVLQLRESLRPYISRLSAEAATTGMPLMRAMILQFPNDPGVRGVDVENQYMLGPEYLVSPVTTYRAKSWSVYLPAAPSGSSWKYFFNQTSVGVGGRRVTSNTPIGEFPLYQLVAN